MAPRSSAPLISAGRGARLSPEAAWLGLVFLTLVRFAVAWAAPLAPDEAYYWVWSHALAPGYLDAPPMVALWVRAGTAIAGPGELGIRLLGPISVAIGSGLMWDAGERLLPGRRAGVFAAALLNATLLFNAGAVIMTPDTPLLFFWVCCLWALARFTARPRTGWLILAGLFGGLALDSKYTAALLAPAFLVWLDASPSLRVWLLRPAPWLAAILAATLFAPVIAWNAAHGWVSFVKQGGRVEDFELTNAIRFLGELVLGQAGLATPLIFVLAVAGTLMALRRGWHGRDPASLLPALLTLIPTLVFVQHAFGDRVQANWPAIVYPSATIAAAGLERPLWVRLAWPALILGFFITAVAYLQASLAPLPLPPAIDPTAQRLGGWTALASQVEAVRRAAGAEFVVADEYGIAAELARTLPPGVAVIGVEPRWRLFRLPHPQLAGQPGILVRSTRRGADISLAPWSMLRPLGEAKRLRNGATIEAYRLYEVIGRPSHAGEAILPRPH